MKYAYVLFYRELGENTDTALISVQYDSTKLPHQGGGWRDPLQLTN